jgi:hypothetical protein
MNDDAKELVEVLGCCEEEANERAMHGGRSMHPD